MHTLLLADDSVTIQRVIELTFADEDIQVVAVSDGDAALAALERTPPDIVLADVGMPGRNGYEVAEHIKRTPRLAHIPVVLLTGAFEPVDRARATAAGCDGVLTKPFEPHLVIGRVKELLARSRQAEPALGALDAPAAPAPQPWTDLQLPDVPPESSVVHSTDDYFDRLDQAFASLTNAHSAPAPEPQPAGSDYSQAEAHQYSDDHPVSYGSPLTDFQRGGDFSPPPQEQPARGGAAAAAAVLPSLAEAFAALLAAEEQRPPTTAPAWPAAAAPVPTPVVESAPPAIDDALVDRIVRRVLDEMSDRIVRDTVAGIVSAVAERLVTEEIERIKGNIK